MECKMKGHRLLECPDRKERNRKILELFNSDHSVNNIGIRYGLAGRTIRRIVREGRNVK